jgi:hypothetical protein
MIDLVKKALSSKRESKSVEFKQAFDVASQGDWCELIKDIIALANSGGGIILIGVDNHGQPTGFNIKPIIEFDSANITNKIHKYTEVQFSEFEILEEEKEGHKVAVLIIPPVSIPIIFTKPGSYDIGAGKQKTAFGQGTVYFRHGAKSETGNTEDIRKAIERQLESIRKDWIRGVRKVVTAPRGSKVVVASGEVTESGSPNATPIRIVNDPTAPAYRKIDPDISHPYRTKDLIQILNDKLAGQIKLTTHDVLCIRRLFGCENNPSFCHKPTFSSMQFSEALINWIMQKYAADPSFFDKVRQECHEKRFELGLASSKGKRRRHDN